MTWTTPDYELKALDAMKQLKVVNEMNDSWSWAQGSRSHEHLKVMDDMKDSSSHKLKALDVVSSISL